MEQTKWLKGGICLLVLAVLLCMRGTVGHAQDQSNKAFVYNPSTKELKISGISDVTNLDGIDTEIQNEIRIITIGNDVKTIGEGVFFNLESLRQVRFVDKDKSNMVSFGKRAFSCCYNLRQVEFPKKLESIAGNCFYKCSHLEYVRLPAAVRSVGQWAFWESGIKELMIEDGLTTLPSYVFSGCKSLEKVTLANTITEIGNNCFESDSKITSLQLPSALKKLGDEVFYGCSSIINLRLPSNLQAIGYGCFQKCVGIRKVTYPKSLTQCGGNEFADTNVEEVAFEQGTTKIPDRTCMECHTLKKVTMPDTVTDIGSWVFNQCYNLSYIKLSNTLRTIGYGGFEGCYQLHKITIPAMLVTAKYMFRSTGIEEVTFAEGMRTIPEFICCDAHTLKKVTLPQSLEEIPKYAFSGCSSLSYIKIPKAVKSIEMWAFTGCGSLSRIDIEGVETSFTAYSFDEGHHNVVYGVYGSKAEQMCGYRGMRFVTKYKDLQYVSVSVQGVVQRTGSNTMAKVVVTDNGKVLKQNEDYTISCSNNKGPGKATVVIKGYKNGYYGSITKTYTIIPGKKEKYQVGYLRYQINNPSTNGKGTVSVVSVVGKRSQVTIPKTVKIAGYTYRVTSVEANAFYKQTSVKKVCIESQEITWIGKNAFNCINKKAVIQVPKNCFSRYSNLIKKSKIEKTVVIRK